MSNPKVLSQQKGHKAQIITHSVGKELREPLVVQFSEYRGRHRVSLRFHYYDGAGNLSPGRRGAEFAIPMLDDVIEALQKVKEEQEAGKAKEAKEELPW